MIRPYRPADCQELLGVWARASAVAHPFVSRECLERERRSIPDVCLPHAETWIWDAGGHVVGVVSLLGSKVGALFVDSDWQRSGIGRALIDRARTERGALEVEVFEKKVIEYSICVLGIPDGDRT